MAQATRHDAWQAGDSYDLYMGRWSRQIAPPFLDWLGAGRAAWIGWRLAAAPARFPPPSCRVATPGSLICIDPSEGFLAKARSNVPDARVESSRPAMRRHCL